MTTAPDQATTVDTSNDTELSPTTAKVLKGTAAAIALPVTLWPTLSVAGGITLATVTTGGLAPIALGVGAAAVGVERTVSRVKRLKALSNLFDQLISNDESTLNAPKKPLTYRSLPLNLATGGLLLGGGIALAATAGGFIAGALAATMIVSGGISAASGTARTIAKGLSKLFPKKQKKEEAPAAEAPQITVELETAVSSLGTLTAQTAFAAATTPAAEKKPAAAKPAPKPATAPKGPQP